MRYERMTKAQLIAELRRRDTQAKRERKIEELVHELTIYQEEVKVQNLQLMQAQEEIEAARDKYLDLYDFAPIAYVTLNPKGLIRELNLAGACLLAADRARIIGAPFLGFIQKLDRRAFLDYMRVCRVTSKARTAYLSLQPRQGDVIPVQLLCRRSLRGPGQEPWLNIAITDLTDIKRTEGEVRASEQKEQAARAANQAKDQFLAMLSHELRTPLTPVLFGIHTLQQAIDIPDAWNPTLAMMRRNAELEVRLIDDLLDVTGILRGKLSIREEIVDMHAVVRGVLDVHMPALREAKLEVTVNLYAKHSHVRGDSARLHQVVSNLLRNAINATPAGGRITIRSLYEPAEGRLTLAVSDTGIGIAPAMLERIFLPFEQVSDAVKRRGGLGLGLAICKGLVEAHQGIIRVTSRGENQGATFEVELMTAPAVPAKPTYVPVRASRQVRILLVEDHVDTAELLAKLLTQHGYEVKVAHTLGDARAIANQAWDLFVMDIGLPDGSGLDFVREQHKHRPIKAIAMSGYGRSEDIRASKAAGCRGHLTKPPNFQELIATIERVAAES